jgi:hypothetical protein
MRHSSARGPNVSAAQAFVPPSTVRFAPVMYEDSGPAHEGHQRSNLINMPVAVERCDGFLGYRPIARGRIQIRVDRTRLDVDLVDVPGPTLCRRQSPTTYPTR